MSDTQFKLIDTSNGIEKTFDSRSAAEEKKQELDGLGGPYEIQRVSENGNGVEAAETPTQPTDDVDVVDHTEQNEPTPATHDAPDTSTVTDAVDSASIADDPLDYMPSHFVDTIQGVPTINRKGYAVLAEHYDISVVASPVVRASETGWEYAEFRAIATTAEGVEYSGFGSAHVDRGDGDDKFLLNELAETRAMKRATAFATGLGMTAQEEMEGSL